MLGPAPCTIKQLTLARAIESISFLLLPQTKISCKNISKMMLEENGVDNAIDSFYSHLPYNHMLCEVIMSMGPKLRYILLIILYEYVLGINFYEFV